MCHCLELDNTTVICLFVTLITQVFAIVLVTEIFKPQLFCSHATSYKADWILTTDCCLFCVAFFICAHIQSDKGSWNGLFGISSSPEFLCDYTTIICLFVIPITQLFAIVLATEIFKPRLFCSHATSHKADCILTVDCSLLCVAFLYAHVFSLIKVLEMDRSGFRLFQNSSVTIQP